MDELIELVARLKALRADYPHLAVQASNFAVQNATMQLRAAVNAIEETVAEHQAEARANAGLVTLPGFVDLTAPVAVTPAVADLAVATHAATADVEYNGDLDDEYDDEDYDDEPVPAAPLTAEVTGVTSTDDVTAALAAVLPSVLEKFTGYVIEEVTSTGAVLAAPDDQGIAAGSLPNGTEVFSGHVPTLDATVSLRIAGEIDPENPPLDPAAVTNEIVEQMIDAGDEVPDVEEIRVVLQRQDEQELTYAQAQVILPTAVTALSALLGAHRVLEVVDGESVAEKVAVLAAAGEGRLDRRALTLRVAQFDGVLPFPGIGRVRAFATV